MCFKASTASCQRLATRINEVEAKLNLLTASSSTDALMKESYSKRFNILIHGLAEDESTVWEKRETTLQIFKKFLRKGLKIKPEEIPIADIHRLPQRPVLRNGLRKCRPIIVKLTTAINKAKNHIMPQHICKTFPIPTSRAWYGMEDNFSIFHTGNFVPFHFHSIPKIFHFIFHSMLKFSSTFHSILKFSSIFHSILPYQRNFRLEAMQRIFCCFALLQCCNLLLEKVRQQY